MRLPTSGTKSSARGKLLEPGVLLPKQVGVKIAVVRQLYVPVFTPVPERLQVVEDRGQGWHACC